MRNKVIVLALSVIMVLCSSFSVFASSVVNLDMTEPSCSDTQGYLVTADASLENVNVFYWSINPYVANGENQRGTLPSMNLVLDDDSILLTALYSGTARMTLTRVFNSSTQWVLKSANFTNSSTYEHTSTNPIKYYCYNGNIGMVDDNVSSSANYLSVNWGHDASYQDEFDKLVKLLESIDGSVDNLYDKSITINNNLVSLNNKVSDTNDKLDSANGTLTDIKDTAAEISFQLVDVLDMLDNIYNSTDSIDGKMDTVITALDDIFSQLSDANDTLTTISSQLDEYFSAEGSEDTSALDDSSLTQNESLGDVLINDESTGQVIQGMDNMNSALDSILRLDGFTLVWDWIDRAILSNEKVLFLVFFCLTMGVIKLIFNR